MKVDVYSNMHNEEFLVPYWLRHYETIADRIFIWEDESTDATKDILSRHPKVIFLPMEKHGDDDGYWTTELFPRYEKYSRGEADWVIIADADEFVYHPKILEVLAKAKEEKIQLIKCNGFTMVSENLPTANGQIYDEIKLGLPDLMESKWTIHSPDAYIRYGRGRHVEPNHNRSCVKSTTTGIKLFHYRYFGEEYYENRDKKILERNRMVYHFTKGYSREERRTLPDKTRGSALDWFAAHKTEAMNIVDAI